MSDERGIVFVDNDNRFLLREVKLASDDSYINDAVVQMTIKDSNNQDVGGITWPVFLAFTGNDGEYAVTIEEVAQFIDDGGYTAYIDAETPGGVTGHWEYPIGAETRTS